MRWSRAETARSHLGSNLDLTVTSLAAFLGTPATFVHGVIDPEFEFRLLQDGSREVASNLAAGLRDAPVVARGSVRLADRPAPALETVPQKLTLQPGRRYLLTFDFHTPPLPGKLVLSGPSLSRFYLLPAAGESQGFSGWSRATAAPLDLDGAGPAGGNRISLRDGRLGPPASAGLGAFADFTLQLVDSDRLPVRLEGLLPLRATVDAPDANDYVETPRRYLEGYAAWVDGRPVEPLRSPDWDIMVPVPRGRSTVEIRYVGAPLVRRAFWLSAASWLAFGVWLLGRIGGIRWRRALRLDAAGRGAWRVRFWLLAAAVLAGVIARIHARHQAEAADRDAVGPVRVECYLPFHQTGRQQPLVETGHTGAGANVFVQYLDDEHVRIGADIWGTQYRSDPIATDYFQVQDPVVDSSALYPLDHPRVQALSVPERNRLRGDFRVEWNGRLVLEVPRPAYESTAAELVIGENRIGSSGAERRFAGTILRVSRPPFSVQRMLDAGQALRLRASFPTDQTGRTEPLLALGPAARDGACVVTYLPARPAALQRPRRGRPGARGRRAGDRAGREPRDGIHPRIARGRLDPSRGAMAPRRPGPARGRRPEAARSSGGRRHRPHAGRGRLRPRRGRPILRGRTGRRRPRPGARRDLRPDAAGRHAAERSPRPAGSPGLHRDHRQGGFHLRHLRRRSPDPAGLRPLGTQRRAQRPDSRRL